MSAKRLVALGASVLLATGLLVAIASGAPVGSAVRVYQPAFGALPTGVTIVNKRATVTGAENTLGTFVTIPVGTDVPVVYPRGVMLQVERADAAVYCYVVVAGAGAASATNGFELPSAPGTFYFEGDVTAMRLYSTGTTHVQCLFLFGGIQ